MNHRGNPFANAFPTFDVDPELLRDTIRRVRKENKDLKVDNKQLEADRDEIYEKLSKTEDDLVDSWLQQKKILIEKNQINNKNVLLEQEIDYLKNELQKQREFVQQKNNFINQLLLHKPETKDKSTSTSTSGLISKTSSPEKQPADKWNAAWKHSEFMYDEEYICSTSEKDSSVDTGVQADIDNDIDNENNIHLMVNSVLKDDEDKWELDEWTQDDWNSWKQYLNLQN